MKGPRAEKDRVGRTSTIAGRLRSVLAVVLSALLVTGSLPAAALAAAGPEEATESADSDLLESQATLLGEEELGVVQVELEHDFTAAVATDGSLWTWGHNDSGELGNGTKEDNPVPVKIMDDVASVALAKSNGAAIKTDGSLWMWGNNSWGQLGNLDPDPSGSDPTPRKVMDDVASVRFHGDFTVSALKEDGSLWMWGRNTSGRLGNGSWDDSAAPTKILDGVATVESSASTTAAIKTDGSLWMWGDNSHGQLGTGTLTKSYAPVKVMDDVAWVSPGNMTAALKTDGTLWTWGRNEYGMLGNGTTADSCHPTKVMGDVSSASISGINGAAVKTDGSLWTWGSNNYGQLGRGGETSTPGKVMGGVSQAFMEDSLTSAALATDGTLWMWGLNDRGQAGNGRTGGSVRSPAEVIEGISWAQGPIGSRNAVVLSDGSLWLWGANNSGGIGNGSTEDCPAPVRVLDDVVSVTLESAGTSAAIQTDGSLWMWGHNKYGQVGGGTKTDRTTPVKIKIDSLSTEPDAPLDPDNPGNPGGITPTKEFRIGTHSNSFVHSNTGTGENVGFAGVDDYSLSASSHEALANLCSSAGVLNTVKERESSEWNGSCYGIAATMGLTYEGILPLSSISSGGNTYFSLALPCQDEKLLDAITFYQLSQFVDTGGDDFAAIESTTRPSFIEGLVNYRGKNGELQDFLEAIVETPEDGSVRMLEYFYSDSGHAILVIGATYDERNDRYIVKLYDENTVPRGKKGAEEGIFTIMIVDGDFSGFEIIGNDSKVIADETTYTAMHLLDLDRLPKYGATAASAAGTLATEEESDSVTIELALNMPVEVTNSLGETLRYDGNRLSGDLEVIDISTVAGNQGSVLVIETTPSERFTFSSPGGTLDASAYDAQGEFCSVSGEGIDAATVSWGESLAIRGDESYELEAFLSTDRLVSDSETGLLSISGNASGEVSLTKDGEGISISGEIGGATLASHESGRVYESEGVDVTTPIRVDHETLAAGDSPDWTSPYPDVREGDWYWDAMMFADTSGTMTGYANGTFGPADPVSRAQMATVLWRLADEPDSDAPLLPDCDPESFYAAPVSWALGTGVFSGYESGLFGPADSLTREQAATVLWRRAGEPEGEADLSDFPDAESVSAFAREAMRWAVSEHVITGTGKGTLDPTGTCSRAELATILMRMDEAGKL